MAPSSVLATTLTLLRDKLIDNSFLAHPLIRAIEDAGNLVMVEGGQIIEQPVVFGSHSSITQYTNGFEPQNMAVRDPFNKAKFEYATFSAPVALSAVEKMANKGELAVVNILESKVKNVMLDLRKSVSQQIIRGDVTNLSNLETLNGNGTSTFAVNGKGWLEGVARASQANTVGGLSKATYQAEHWFNQFQDAGGTLTISHIDQMFIQAGLYALDGGTPDILLMSAACYTAFLKLMDQRIQYVTVTDRDGLNAKSVETYRGAKIYVDPNLGFTANAASGMGAKKVSAYLLNSRNFQLYADRDGWFQMGDLTLIPGTVVEQATIMCRMQLVTGHLASHAVLIDAEA